MPGTIPKLMNAVWYEANGDAADVLVHGEMPVPQPAAGEVLVRLGASGVNPSDVKARAGSRPMGFDRVIPHSDGAGTVEMVGEGVDPDLQDRRVYLATGSGSAPMARRRNISRLMPGWSTRCRTMSASRRVLRLVFRR